MTTSKSKRRKQKASERRKERRKERSKFEHVQVNYDELKSVLERVQSLISAEDHGHLKAVIETLAFLTQELEAKGTTLKKLRRLLFGPDSEKSKDVLGRDGSAPGSGGSGAASAPASSGDEDSTTEAGQPDAEEAEQPAADEEPPAPPPGHGRNPAAAYTGAELVQIQHDELTHKHACPDCDCGKVYHQKDPARIVRIKGMGPLSATVYEMERLRCNLCGKVFTADVPEGVGEEKYDASARAMIGLLKYGYGMPFTRLEKFMGHLGIPLPASTQWDQVELASTLIKPAWDALIKQAAQGDVLYNDDTNARVLELKEQIKAEEKAGNKDVRKGIYTSAIVSTDADGHDITLYFTGNKHAGENLKRVLDQRDNDQETPIQMCDALSRNMSPRMETLLSHCNAHARRQFVTLAKTFPDQCERILETFGAVYKHDATTKDESMSVEQRLAYHQEHSGPLMDALDDWLDDQFEQRLVEPNSSLGGAILYLQEHWDELTLFLREPNAPLDSNIVERSIKRAIRHRRNSLFFLTIRGAEVGDHWMSLIETTERNDINVWLYLVAMLENGEAVKQDPEHWLPWNYEEGLARASPGET